MRALLCHDRFVSGDELDAIAARLPDAGAVASLTGIARPSSHASAPVTALFLDDHPRLTLASLDRIAGDPLGRFEIEGFAHRPSLRRDSAEPIEEDRRALARWSKQCPG